MFAASSLLRRLPNSNSGFRSSLTFRTKTNTTISLVLSTYCSSMKRNVKTDVNKISKGDIIKDGANKYLQVERYVFAKRARSNAIVTFETVELLTGKKISKKCRGGESLDLCEYSTKDVTYSSETNKGFVFEDMKDGTEYTAPKSIFTNEMIQIMKGGSLKKIIIGIDEETNTAIKIMFPTTLIATVEKTDDVVSGIPNDRHSPVTKNAVLDIGITVKVPGFIANGDRIKVLTRDWSYAARATEDEEQAEDFEDTTLTSGSEEGSEQNEEETKEDADLEEDNRK
ncbi:hypothetical protein FDP41_012319 [Naegleria fowleri]|uniref:Elongation factor P C-terminal domain-containing protein n=1 Tax=Naegleria fowleri TaxID=5763 RepID=A0A6A5C4G4_NAEFO|nr:uncharacterized protein FDP41_012319 [Naegleria fowleri]KAF0981662.1 hypothetical protein FDP41_012319 [Naegleria fowleri]CAG4719227.1 unnamed protein product [Naegleria fowleri]